jgi:hypothetical protein
VFLSQHHCPRQHSGLAGVTLMVPMDLVSTSNSMEGVGFVISLAISHAEDLGSNAGWGRWDLSSLFLSFEGNK